MTDAPMPFEPKFVQLVALDALPPAALFVITQRSAKAVPVRYTAELPRYPVSFGSQFRTIMSTTFPFAA